MTILFVGDVDGVQDADVVVVGANAVEIESPLPEC